MTSQSQTFAIFRIIGNSLPPRHSADNVIKSTQYILAHEDEFEGCEKLWILNKIVDKTHKQHLIHLLAGKKQRFIDIPFDPDAHFNSFLDVTGAPVALRFALKEQNVRRPIPTQMDEWRIRHKSQELVGINEARNIALKFGRAHYDWSVIADGGIVFSREGWNDFVQGLEREPERRIAILPMYRMYEWKPLIDYAPEGTQHEPQLAFHRTSEEIFDPSRRYGDQNKSELIVRLGFEGPWQEWSSASWDLRQPLRTPNFKNYAVAGFVYRLPADGSGEEKDTARYVNRFLGVHSLSFKVDLITAYHKRNSHRELLDDLPRAIGDDPRSALQTFIDALLEEPDRFVTGKRIVPPSGDRHDYYSTAPYYSSAGVMYDGYIDEKHRAMTSEDAVAFRTFAWRFNACAVAGVVAADATWKQRAIDLLQGWFVNPETRMTPSARYAQQIPGKGGVNDIGIIEFRQLANVARSVRLLHAHGAIDDRLFELFKTWIETFLDDCEQSGIRERSLRRNNNIGTWSAALFGTLDLFCNRYTKAFAIAYQASERLGRQFGPFSIQFNEIGRQKPLHYCLFNLGAWFHLAQICREFGIDIFRFSGVDGESLSNALAFCAQSRSKFRDYENSRAQYDAWISSLKMLYQGNGRRRVLLIPTPHWGLPPIAFC